jgi:5-methylcytosine-specific restriction endonuclease McrA
MEYPNYISGKRIIKNDNGKRLAVDPSERRIEARKAVYDIIVNTKSEIGLIDSIIDYFRGYYEGEPWNGIGKKQRVELFVQEKGRCHWCQKRLTIHNFTIEHLKPRIEGGGDEWSNLSIACNECNTTRGGLLFDRYGYLKAQKTLSELDKEV